MTIKTEPTPKKLDFKSNFFWGSVHNDEDFFLCFCSFSFGNEVINGFKEIDSDLVNESAAHKDDDADCCNLQREVPLGVETHFLGHWENTVPNELAEDGMLVEHIHSQARTGNVVDYTAAELYLSEEQHKANTLQHRE